MIRRRLLLAGLPGLVALAPGCAPTPRTAASHGPDDGGIGGTGVFGSIVNRPGPDARLAINGLWVETSAATVFDDTTAGFAPPRRLPHAGETVAIEATASGAARLVAGRVATFHPLVGPLRRLPDGGMAVLGTRVEVPTGTPVHGPTGRNLTPRHLVAGAPVAVSGLWRGETVLATHVAMLDGTPQATVRGLLRRQGSALLVGGTRLLADAAMLQQAAPGNFVVAAGNPGSGPDSVQLSALETRPLAVFAGRVSALSVEGFLAPNLSTPGFHLSGFGLPLDPASRIGPPRGARQVMLGRYRERFLAQTALDLPADAMGRARVLSAPETDAAIRRWLSEA
jgi:hypothetical protein